MKTIIVKIDQASIKKNPFFEEATADVAKWFYNYEKPMVECNNCKVSMPINQIQTLPIDNNPEQPDVCPICRAYNTFPIRTYEDINDAVNLLKLN